MKSSVAFVINTRASFVTIPVSSSKLMIWRTRFSGRLVNLPVKITSSEVLTTHLLLFLLHLDVARLWMAPDKLIVLSFHFISSTLIYFLLVVCHFRPNFARLRDEISSS
jgi:hypothetical protein